MKTKFSHVMNDDITGITFLYFNQGTIQLFMNESLELDESFCIHLDSADHKKLESALRREPYDCTCFNQDEMKVLKEFISQYSPRVFQPASMTDTEWKAFLEKLL